jgi:hypothetical protein
MDSTPAPYISAASARRVRSLLASGRRSDMRDLQFSQSSRTAIRNTIHYTSQDRDQMTQGIKYDFLDSQSNLDT